MNNIKKPIFDDCPRKGIIKDYPSNLLDDLSFDIGMIVSVIYKEKTTTIKVEGKISDDEFTGVITGFEPPSETHKDLSLGKRVIFSKQDVCWVHKETY